jgi:hypothetical protein
MWMSRQKFIDFFPQQVQKEKGSRPLSPIQTFMQSRPEQVYDSVDWDPSKPPGEYARGERRIWNLWEVPTWFGEEGEVETWLGVMDRVYGEEADLVIKRMAYDIQYPHLRPQWHVLIKGHQGVGKSLSNYAVMEWAKRYDLYASVNVRSIKSDFNSFMDRKKIITVNEVKGIDSNIFNAMKDWLAGTESKIEVNEKFMKKYYVSNVASFYFSTNAADPVSIDRKERRLLVVKSDAESPETMLEKKEARAEFNWVQKNWSRIVWHLKHNVEVPVSFGQTLPKVTQAQLDLAEMTAPMHDEIAEMLKPMMNGQSLFTIEGVMNKLMFTSGPSIDTRNLNNKSIAKALFQAGALKCNDRKQIRFGNNVRRYVWTFDPDLAKVSGEQVRNLWDLMGFTDDDSEMA